MSSRSEVLCHFEQTTPFGYRKLVQGAETEEALEGELYKQPLRLAEPIPQTKLVRVL